MSIDNCFWARSGVRNTNNIDFVKYRFDDSMPAECLTARKVFLVHGADIAIDEVFFFESPEDAIWFWQQGYKQVLFAPHLQYDRMTLCINDQEVEWRSTAAK